MSYFKTVDLIIDKKFDQATKRQLLNDFVVVLHCHHYTTLYTQLAIDANETQLLTNVAEETFYELLTQYFKQHGIKSLQDKIDVACQYYGAVGLGKMVVNFAGESSGEVELILSHLDSGWLRKWGKNDTPVNFITSGYIQAMFSALFEKSVNTFTASEIRSIVMTDNSNTSLFNVYKY